MPIREYLCPNCNLLMEKIHMAAAPDTEICDRCKAYSMLQKMPSRVALLRSEMDNAPIDNIIGKDANKRWEELDKRQKTRDAVREATGSVGLTAISKDEYVPATEENVATRVEIKEGMTDPEKISPGVENSQTWLSTQEE